MIANIWACTAEAFTSRNAGHWREWVQAVGVFIIINHLNEVHETEV